MKVEFKRSFLKELQKIRNKELQMAVYDCIVEVEAAENITFLKNIKKLRGYDLYYRIRIGDYRIGIKIENEIVYFVVFENRKDIYRKFP